MSVPTPQPTPILPPATGPLARYLAHPGAETARLLHHLGALAAHLGVTAGPAVVAGIVLVVAVTVTVVRRRQAGRLADGARLVQVLAPPDVDPQGAATLWTNLVALLRPAWRRALGGQPHLAFELTASDAGLIIAWWVPGTIPPGLVERAVEAAWPGARTETLPATPPLAGVGVATGGELRLALPEQYPLRTEHKVDPLRPLLGALDGIGEAESACVQVLARPLTGRRLTHLHKAAAARRAGRPATRAARLVDLVTPGPTAQPANTDPSRSADVADILDKAAQPCWAICVRYAVATSATDSQAPARLRGRAHAVASAFSLFAGRNRLDRRRLRHPAQVLAGRRFGRGDLVSVAELAALAHLPTDQTVPGLARAGAKAVAPPPALARPAALAAATGTQSPKVLGDAQAGARRPVALAVPDARYHLHVMGATGSGKSTLLTNLVLGDIDAGRGVVVIDPKGDLITDLCDRLPAGAESRTVLIDPEDPDAAPILNVLSGPDPDLVVDNLVGIFRSIFAAFWGPRTDDVLRAACLTLLRHAAATGASTSLADVPRLLADDTFRAPMVATVADDTVGLGGFWDVLRGHERGQPGPGHRPAHEQAARLPPARLRPPGRRPPRLQLRHGQGPRRRRLPRPGPQGHPGRGHRPPARQLRGGQGMADRHPPGPARPGRPRRRRRWSSTSARTSCTCPAPSTRCWPRPAATGSRWSSPTSTSASSPRSCARRCRPTPAPRSGSPCPPRTPAPSNATSPPTSPSTTSPTSAPTPRPPASSSTARRPPPSPSPPAPRRRPSPGRADAVRAANRAAHSPARPGPTGPRSPLAGRNLPGCLPAGPGVSSWMQSPRDVRQWAPSRRPRRAPSWAPTWIGALRAARTATSGRRRGLRRVGGLKG